MSVGGVLVYGTDPFGETHFLLDLAHSETIVPLAYGGASVLTALVMLPLIVAFVQAVERPELRAAMPGLFPEEYGERVVTHSTGSQFASSVVVLGGAVYAGAYLGIRCYVPYVQHLMAQTEAAEERFLIRDHLRSRYCRGVVATNPRFYSDNVCGVLLQGKWEPYYARELVLTGRRSPYGFYVERYDLPRVP